MYLTHVRLENIKCFADISLDFKASRNDEATRQQNWNVILGDNAAGKTTLLQAIAACLMDSLNFNGIVPFQNWTRQGEGYSRLTLNVQDENNFKDSSLQSDPYGVQHVIVPPTGFVPHNKRVFISRDAINENSFIESTQWFGRLNAIKILLKSGDDTSNLFESQRIEQFMSYYFDKTPRISCGYGTLRRSRGSTTHGINIEDNSIAERFITLFVEEAALYKGEDWLKDLERFALKRGPHSEEQKKFDLIKQTIIEVLPEVEEVILDDRLRFIQAGQKYTLDQLSDGYRAIFVLALDILRWLDLMNADATIPLNHAAGVVLIDEIDAHLHPKWQRKIGFELTRIFPNIQFIVTTHSPYIAMAAGEGALTVLEKVDDAVIANQTIPLVRDWTVDRILNDLFHESKYSQETKDDLDEYNDLLAQAQQGSLEATKRQRLDELEKSLNERLTNDRNAPQNQSMQTDLDYLKHLIRQKQEQRHA